MIEDEFKEFNIKKINAYQRKDGKIYKSKNKAIADECYAILNELIKGMVDELFINSDSEADVIFILNELIKGKVDISKIRTYWNKIEQYLELFEIHKNK